jgi:hypothetical protein
MVGYFDYFVQLSRLVKIPDGPAMLIRKPESAGIPTGRFRETETISQCCPAFVHIGARDRGAIVRINLFFRLAPVKPV